MKGKKFMVQRYKEIMVSIVLLPLILIVLWNETLLWRFERNWSWCWWDMKENIRFWSYSSSQEQTGKLLNIFSIYMELLLWKAKNIQVHGTEI